MDHLIVQAAVYLGAAVLAVPLAARLGLGSVLGFLGAGIVIGPVLGLVGRESEALRDFGEYGIAVMLFLVGLEVSPRALWSLRQKLLGLGGLQIVLTVAWFLAAGLAIGHPWNAALAIGLVLSPSSTAIVIQTLSEKGLLNTPGGRSGFAVLLAQDIAVIPMLAILPLLADRVGPGDEPHGLSLVGGLPAWAVALLTVGAVTAVVLTGIFLTRPVFRWIGRARLREIDTALALFVVVSITLLMELVGLSPALGTFLAGVVLAGSEFRHELESDLQPFKGLLLGLFFMGVGAGVDADRLLTNPMGFVALTLGLMGAKALILFLLASLFGLGGRDRWVLTLGLAQGGEFGFVLVAYALSLGVLTDWVGQQLLLLIALSMLATPLLFLIVERFLPSDSRGAAQGADEPVDQVHPVIVAGMGRFGRTVHRLLRTAGQEAVLLDTDMEAIELMRARGHRVFLGDPTRPEMLAAAGLDGARVLVAALDDAQATTRLVAAARKRRPDLHIIARATNRTHGHVLVHAGADEVLGEVFDASLRAGRHVLEALGWDPVELAEAERLFAGLERDAHRELSQLWRPDLPEQENEPYRLRSRELAEEIERALSERLTRRPGA